MSSNNIQKFSSIQKPRVMMLDIDDTLLVWTRDARGWAAPRAAEFVHWALEHFEVRWLTMWCPSGRLQPEGAVELSNRFNKKVLPETFYNIRNPKSFVGSKVEGIDFEDPRPWVWVEDGLLSNEQYQLKSMGVFDNFYKTNVSHNSVMLQKTWRLLADKFDLPKPATPYLTTVDYPLALIQEDASVQSMIDKLISRYAKDIGKDDTR